MACRKPCIRQRSRTKCRRRFEGRQGPEHRERRNSIQRSSGFLGKREHHALKGCSRGRKKRSAAGGCSAASLFRRSRGDASRISFRSGAAVSTVRCMRYTSACSAWEYFSYLGAESCAALSKRSQALCLSHMRLDNAYLLAVNIKRE